MLKLEDAGIQVASATPQPLLTLFVSLLPQPQSRTNPEVIRARELSILFGLALRCSRICVAPQVAVAGTHGKITTSSFATMLDKLGADPSF